MWNRRSSCKLRPRPFMYIRSTSAGYVMFAFPRILAIEESSGETDSWHAHFEQSESCRKFHYMPAHICNRDLTNLTNVCKDGRTREI